MLVKAQELAPQYRSAKPFPHVVIDDFLPSDVVDECIAEFPSPGEDLTFWGDEGRSHKFGTNDELDMGPTTRQVIAQINGGGMIKFLEELTGIRGLVSDPHLVGGGIHLLGQDGFLNVHADFNVHHDLKLDRRINVLLYFNPDWEEEWGGNLELWNADATSCERRVVPIAGRCVIFNTTDVALHGNPQPVNSPNGTPRRSLAFYYYTAGRPREERTASHATIYPERGERARPSVRERRQALKDRSVHVALRWLPPALVDAVRKRRQTGD
ncbi:MAG: 2OG-Fe(II) oxygenase [Actinomycetota bacterium]|nr:2OG-Fe(II) oxygenase [Actinomycetota bacterium]